MSTDTQRLEDLLTKLAGTVQTAGPDQLAGESPRYRFVARSVHDGNVDQNGNPKTTECLVRLRPDPSLEDDTEFGAHGISAAIPLVRTATGKWYTLLCCTYRAPLGKPPEQTGDQSWTSTGKQCIEFPHTLASRWFDEDGARRGDSNLRASSVRALKLKAGLSERGDANFGPLTFLEDLGPAATHPGTENTVKATHFYETEYRGSDDIEFYRYVGTPQRDPKSTAQRVNTTCFAIPLEQMRTFADLARTKGFAVDEPVNSHGFTMSRLGSKYIDLFPRHPGHDATGSSLVQSHALSASDSSVPPERE